MPRFKDQPYWLFLVWLLVTGFVTFGLMVCWNEGLLRVLFDSDRSRICLIIGLLYLLGSAHCARRALFLARETERVRSVSEYIGNRVARVESDGESRVKVDGHALDADSVIGEHLQTLIRRGDKPHESAPEGEQSSLIGTLVAHTKGSHDLGWFMVDVLLKLGLLGTIVGFILMLGSVADTASLDVNTMQKVLKQMSNGMGTALYTTLAGLVSSMALGLQYLLLDKGADDLIERVVRLTDSRLTFV